MKSENLPGIAQKLLFVLALVGSVMLLAGLLLSAWMITHIHGMPLGSLWFAVPGLVIFSSCWGISAFLGRKRTAALRLDNENKVLASGDLPDVSRLSTMDSIMTLRWTMDFESQERMNDTLALHGPTKWLSMLCFVPFLVNGWSSLSRYGLTLAPFVPMLMLVVVIPLAILLRRAITRKQYSLVPRQHFFLIMDPRGIRIVTGKIVSEVPWQNIWSVSEANGIVSFLGPNGTQTIPQYAFYASGDAKSFAATVRALKIDKQPPAHDWSKYGGSPPTLVEDNVWPPPIR